MIAGMTGETTATDVTIDADTEGIGNPERKRPLIRIVHSTSRLPNLVMCTD